MRFVLLAVIVSGCYGGSTSALMESTDAAVETADGSYVEPVDLDVVAIEDTSVVVPDEPYPAELPYLPSAAVVDPLSYFPLAVGAVWHYDSANGGAVVRIEAGATEHHRVRVIEALVDESGAGHREPEIVYRVVRESYVLGEDGRILSLESIDAKTYGGDGALVLRERISYPVAPDIFNVKALGIHPVGYDNEGVRAVVTADSGGVVTSEEFNTDVHADCGVASDGITSAVVEDAQLYKHEYTLSLGVGVSWFTNYMVSPEPFELAETNLTE